MRTALQMLMACGVLACGATAGAGEPSPGFEAPPANNFERPQTSFDEFIAPLARSTGKTFVLDPRVRAKIYTDGVEAKQLRYPVLLQILDSYGYTAVDVNGVVTVLPTTDVRLFPTRTIYKNEASIPDFEWVTRVIRVEKLEPDKMVAVLRPLVHTLGYLGSVPGQNIVVMVDRYANTRRIADLIEKLDKETSAAR